MVEVKKMKNQEEEREQAGEIRTLKEGNQEQRATLESQKTELASQKTEINKLKQELKVKQVAFSASLLNQGSGDTGPFNTEATVIFKRVVTNIGNAYNPNTGIFTAPVRGAYYFGLTLHGHGDPAYPTAARLFKNGELIFSAWEHQPANSPSTSNGASLLLEVGDQVLVRLWAGAKIYDDSNYHSIFRGHLLFTM
ncbi:complement C1q tumor necrosis factor-related protein 3-like [Archocentrus centrarchus]|uniref:complement C1q tumor necrosis factor-related protein 3-like n=1 Tax=Archocentrus centrarchus TaxID=63155 RepID=UPI0011EA2BD2|nr:complement C1q tumor necrosis factor-related protein 3-like [Archocentrus centrarchus]